MTVYRNLRVAAGAALFTGLIGLCSPASAGPISITLDPSQTNGGSNQIDSGTTAFTSSNATFNYYAFLSIASSSGLQPFTESGNILISNFMNSYNGSNLGAAGDRYNIYGTFVISGAGLWQSGNTDFCVNAVSCAGSGVTSLSIKLYAQPNGGTQPTFTIPSTIGATGVTIPANNFQIANIVPAPGSTFFAHATTTSAGGPALSLNATLLLQPLAGFSGPTGFFTKPILFDIALTASSTSINTAESDGSPTTFTVGLPGGCTNFASGGANACTFGNGQINYLSIPEPNSLLLLGAGLLGFGLLARRHARRTVAED